MADENQVAKVCDEVAFQQGWLAPLPYCPLSHSKQLRGKVYQDDGSAQVVTAHQPSENLQVIHRQ